MCLPFRKIALFCLLGALGALVSGAAAQTIPPASRPAPKAQPRLGELYAKYLQAWTEGGGDLFCYFSSVGAWSKHGSWGAMQYYDDEASQCPKYKAILQWAKTCGQNVKAIP